MTLKYEILKRLVKALNIKKMSSKPADEIIALKKKQNKKLVIPQLQDAEIDCRRITVDGFTVLRMTHKKRAERANMFIIGGGMVSPPRPGSIKKALRFAKETGLDLFIPYYPLCVDYPLSKAYSMIHATYKMMLEEYGADHISLLGTSSGGNLALGLVTYINAEKLNTPMPAYIMAISPGTCCADEEEWKRMLELDKKDVAISAQYMKTAEEIMRHDDASVPEYMIFLQKGDFTNCPHTTFIYGSDEALYAIAPSFEKAMKRDGVHYDMIVGEGMFHCYPVFPLVKEAKDGWNMMVRMMKDKWPGRNN
ncbi:MAG: alpha/beta hydrolase [Oscillospiraceae bacterium]|nr:alpha/beta hydrolase [Oscillospiraceae bacterium]